MKIFNSVKVYLMNLNFIFKKVVVFKKFKPNLTAVSWFLLTFITSVSEILRGPHAINNYRIFKQVFFHTINQVNLYTSYPAEYFDLNHYGILFSILIVPFALMPDWLGCLLWCLTNSAILFYAVKQLPLSDKNKTIILAIALIELLTSIHNAQFNPMMAAFIIFPFVLVNQKKEWLATLFIAAGILIKLYGIVALVTFLFSNNKMKFTGWFILWMLVLALIPAAISSPLFVYNSYIDWYHSIQEKNVENLRLGIVFGQNISVFGMIQRVFYLPGLSQLWVLVPAAILNLLPLLRFSVYKSTAFQLYYLSLCLISVVIFSSSAESSTYIIAVCGVAIWFILGDIKNTAARALLMFTFIFTILSPTDIYPNYIQKHFFVQYALKALPCFVVWVVVVFNLLTKDFNTDLATVKVESAN